MATTGGNAAPKRIGELLLEAKLISQEQLDEMLKLQKGGDGRKLGQLLIDSKLVSEMQLTQTLSRQLSVPWVSLFHVDFSRSLLNLVTKETAEAYSVVPIFVRKVRKQGETLYIAMDDPTNEAALADVAKTAGIPVRPMIACPSDLRSAIRVYYLGLPAEVAAPPVSQVTLQIVPEKGQGQEKAQAQAQEKRAQERAQERAQTKAERAAERPQANVRDTKPDLPGTRISDPGPPPSSRDSPELEPAIEATEVEIDPTARKKPRMVALTLLDGTTLTLPAVKKRPSRPDAEAQNDQLTARDLVSAFRAVAHGADASEILGEKPPPWEAMFATLLSLMLKKGLIADWEFVEEFRKL